MLFEHISWTGRSGWWGGLKILKANTVLTKNFIISPPSNLDWYGLFVFVRSEFLGLSEGFGVFNFSLGPLPGVLGFDPWGEFKGIITEAKAKARARAKARYLIKLF